MDGEIKIKLLPKRQGEPISIDCVNDSNLDLTDDDRKEIRNLLYKITSDKAMHSSFINCGIEINRTRLDASKKLLFDQITILSFEYPLLAEAIKYLHEKSWEMQGEIQIIQKKVERENQSREAKINLIQNISKNEINLFKAREALVRFMQKKTDLSSKMAQPGNNSQWLAKANVWMSEFDTKIRDIMQQITRYESWIMEGKEKLKNWKD